MRSPLLRALFLVLQIVAVAFAIHVATEMIARILEARIKRLSRVAGVKFLDRSYGELPPPRVDS